MTKDETVGSTNIVVGPTMRVVLFFISLTRARTVGIEVYARPASSQELLESGRKHKEKIRNSNMI